MLGRGGWARARLCALNIGSNVLREGNVAPPWLLPRHTYKLCLKFQGRIHIWTRPWHHYVPLRVHTHRLSLSLSATSPLEFRSVHAPTFARTIHVLGPRHRVLTLVVSLQREVSAASIREVSSQALHVLYMTRPRAGPRSAVSEHVAPPASPLSPSRSTSAGGTSWSARGSRRQPNRSR